MSLVGRQRQFADQETGHRQAIVMPAGSLVLIAVDEGPISAWAADRRGER